MNLKVRVDINLSHKVYGINIYINQVERNSKSSITSIIPHLLGRIDQQLLVNP